MKVDSIAVFKKCIHDLFKLRYSKKKYMDVINVFETEFFRTDVQLFYRPITKINFC